ncbi:MAG: hypothetical protein QXV20_06470 [Candidatus Hadarchaeales archaeon]
MLAAEPSLYEVFAAIRKGEDGAKEMAQAHLRAYPPGEEAPGNPVERLVWLGRKALARWVQDDVPNAYRFLQQALREDPGFAWGEGLALAAHWAQLLQRFGEAQDYRNSHRRYQEAWAAALGEWLDEDKVLDEPEPVVLTLFAAAARLPAAASSEEGKWHALDLSPAPWRLEYQRMNPLELRLWLEWRGEGEAPSPGALVRLTGKGWSQEVELRLGREARVGMDPSWSLEELRVEILPLGEEG